MYFTDVDHKLNFNHLTQNVFHAISDPEYKTAAYILGLPEVYSKCSSDPLLHSVPFLWLHNYTNTSYEDKDNYGTYKVIDFEIHKDADGYPVFSDAFASLSSGYRSIIELANNLFTSTNNDFNLMGALAVWDDNLIKVYHQAVELRMSPRSQIAGLTITII